MLLGQEWRKTAIFLRSAEPAHDALKCPVKTIIRDKGPRVFSAMTT